MAFITDDNVLFFSDDGNDYYFPFGANTQTPPSGYNPSVMVHGFHVGNTTTMWDGTGTPSTAKANVRVVTWEGVEHVIFNVYLTNSHSGQRSYAHVFDGGPMEFRGYLYFPAAHNATGIEIFTYLA